MFLLSFTCNNWYNLKKILKSKYNLINIYIHILLIISSTLSLLTIFYLNIKITFLQINIFFYIFLFAIVISYLLIKNIWLLYSASAIIQENTMLFLALILFNSIPLYIIILMIVPFFVYAHDLESKNYLSKIIITSIWWIITILLFYKTNNILLNYSLHIIIWSVLIKYNILYSGANIWKKIQDYN